MKRILGIFFVVGTLLFVQNDLFAQAKRSSSKKSVVKECQRASLFRPVQKTESQPSIDFMTGLPINDGGGQGRGNGKEEDAKTEKSPPAEVKTPPALRDVPPNSDVYLISKPPAGYTPEAREKNIQGEVILRVTFLASGQIGKISVIKGLPEGLTKQAKDAAAKIRFEPARRNCVDINKTKTFIYSFIRY